MKVLVINCGSSSLKYQVIDSETEHVLAKGLCERIGIDGVLTYQPAGQDKIKYEAAMPAHRQAVELVLKQLTNHHRIFFLLLIHTLLFLLMLKV